jgi:hypothetical protein
MSNDAQRASFRNPAPKPVYEPLKPAMFYANGRTGPPAPMTDPKVNGKHPRLPATETVNTNNAKKSKSKGGRSGQKENTTPAAAKKAQASANAISAAGAVKTDEILSTPQWDVDEKTRLFVWLLGADSEEQDK